MHACMQNLGKSILHSRSSVHRLNNNLKIYLWIISMVFFLLQFCGVATLVIIHKKKFGYRPDMKVKNLSNSAHFLATC
jgi:hypothetical protein